MNVFEMSLYCNMIGMIASLLVTEAKDYRHLVMSDIICCPGCLLAS